MIIERLRREIAMIDFSRDTPPRPDPSEILYGPKVCLMNEYSASDGDLFPYRFRQHKLGKLIGKRSWGGVIGIRGSLPFLDGGTLNKPEFSRLRPGRQDLDHREHRRRARTSSSTTTRPANSPASTTSSTAASR